MRSVVFRTDASLQIGTGHVMRCLTLADALKAHGAHCHFITRAHPGHLLDAIRQRGHGVSVLPVAASSGNPCSSDLDAMGPHHAAWLGAAWQADVEQTCAALAACVPDWLVVDHYALDARWERLLRPHCRRLMVIDDLADRLHDCDLLLDQTWGRDPADYAPWVPAGCSLLCGSNYALLRPEFAALRLSSLQRREHDPELKHLLVTMGGVDYGNATGQVLEALQSSCLPRDCRISVVMGATAPWLEQVRQQARTMPWPVDVKVNVPDMAQIMVNSDLAIGAAGATSWERCCLGLPALMVVLAENQKNLAHALECAGAARVIDTLEEIPARVPDLLDQLVALPGLRFEMGLAASRMVDGLGAETVAGLMYMPGALPDGD